MKKGVLARTGLAVFLAAAGCGGTPVGDLVKALLPDLPYGAPVGGDPIIQTDLQRSASMSACGPGGELEQIIPECPLDLVCFSGACVEHDYCYGRCGADRGVCDAEFFWNMVFICSNSLSIADPQLTRCYELAYIYYAAVNGFGEPYFVASQDFSCGIVQKHAAAEASRRTIDPVIVPPFEDHDGDLLPDDWELQMGLDPLDPHDTLADPDGDGRPNLTEYIRRTHPFVPDGADVLP